MHIVKDLDPAFGCTSTYVYGSKGQIRCYVVLRTIPASTLSQIEIHLSPYLQAHAAIQLRPLCIHKIRVFLRSLCRYVRTYARTYVYVAITKDRLIDLTGMKFMAKGIRARIICIIIIHSQRKDHSFLLLFFRVRKKKNILLVFDVNGNMMQHNQPLIHTHKESDCPALALPFRF